MTTLALLRMAVSGAMAEPITIIWTSSNGSFDDRVEYSNGPAFNVDMNEWVLEAGGTFTTNLGNFTEIEISELCGWRTLARICNPVVLNISMAGKRLLPCASYQLNFPL